MDNSPKSLPSGLFKNRDYLRLVATRLFGTLGMQMLSVAIGWQVYDITHDPFAIGLVGLFQFMPSFILVLFAGHIIDQFPRNRILGASFFVAAFGAGALLLATLGGATTPHIIYAVCVLIGAMRIFANPASQALLPGVVAKDDFSRAVAFQSSVFQVAIIAGPAAAGAAFFLGTSAVYGIAFLFLLIAGVSGILIGVKSPLVKRALNFENLIAGLKFIWARPILLGAITLDLFAVLFGGIVALLPVYARDILEIGPQGLGLLRSMPAVGATLMALALMRMPLRRHAGRWLLASVIAFAISTIVFGFSENVILSAAMMFTLGAADMVSVYVRTHLMQMNTPDDMRGRVASVNMLFITTSNELGDFESGTMAGWFGPVPAVVIGGVLSLGVAGLIAWRVPSLRKLDDLHDVK